MKPIHTWAASIRETANGLAALFAYLTNDFERRWPENRRSFLQRGPGSAASRALHGKSGARRRIEATADLILAQSAYWLRMLHRSKRPQH